MELLLQGRAHHRQRLPVDVVQHRGEHQDHLRETRGWPAPSGQSDPSQRNALSVRLELQADCLAGVWANKEKQKRPNFLEEGDIDAALQTASAIGDDTLQRKSQGTVVPESFTHGSAEQRKRWFMTGFKEGTIKACNTFAASAAL